MQRGKISSAAHRHIAYCKAALCRKAGESMKKGRELLEKAVRRLTLPTDIAAGLPRIELRGFHECSLDCHSGIVEYEDDRVVIALNIGTVTVCGEGLELRQMHREQLCLTGTIREIHLAGGTA